MNLVHYINKTFDEEEALYDPLKRKLIAHGDYYHNHISQVIEGIVIGLEYAGYNVNVTEEYLRPDNPLFTEFDFYIGDDEEDE